MSREGSRLRRAAFGRLYNQTLAVLDSRACKPLLEAVWNSKTNPASQPNPVRFAFTPLGSTYKSSVQLDHSVFHGKVGLDNHCLADSVSVSSLLFYSGPEAKPGVL